MKTQMRFQKYLCLVMILVGAIALFYAFSYCTGSLAELGATLKSDNKTSLFKAREGMNDASLYVDIQGFNNMLMWFGIVMILLAVLLYITSCNKRRKYYISNYVAIGLCAGGNIVLSVVAMIMNAGWKSEFLNIDFERWFKYWDSLNIPGLDIAPHYSESTVMFDLAYAVYPLVIVASLLLILNLVWKIMLMQGEKKLLAGGQNIQPAGGESL
ncbi:MAG: hypothetical protein HDQ88_10985 [Clostridia bacterium]|nr:hypothetical protein [Clostridia bacterium]